MNQPPGQAGKRKASAICINLITPRPIVIDVIDIRTTDVVDGNKGSDSCWSLDDLIRPMLETIEEPEQELQARVNRGLGMVRKLEYYPDHLYEVGSFTPKALRMRNILVEWLLIIAWETGLKMVTFFVSISLLDEHIALCHDGVDDCPLDAKHFQKQGCVCLYLAAKVRGDGIDMHLLSRAAGGAFSCREGLDCEVELADKIGWGRIYRSTCFDYFEIYLLHLRPHREVLEIALYLLLALYCLPSRFSRRGTSTLTNNMDERILAAGALYHAYLIFSKVLTPGVIEGVTQQQMEAMKPVFQMAVHHTLHNQDVEGGLFDEFCSAVFSPQALLQLKAVGTNW